MSILPMSVAKSATSAIQSDGIKIEVEETAQIIVSGLCGTAISRPEDAVRRKIPFMFAPEISGVSTPLLPSSHLLDEAQMTAQAEKIIVHQHEKSGALDELSSIDVQFKALRVVSHVKDHIHQTGLRVDVQKLLFDTTRSLEDRLELIRSMTTEAFGPHSACTAIAHGRMPPLPAYSMPDFVRQFDPEWKGVGFQVSGGNLRNWIASCNPYVIEYPAPNIEEGFSSRVDNLSKSTMSERIELGLGFILVEHDKKFDTFRVVTPMLFKGRNLQEQIVHPFTQGYHLKSYLQDPMALPYTKGYHLKSYSKIYRGAYDYFSKLLGSRGKKNVAKLQVCSKCGTIYSNDNNALAHTSCNV